MLQIGDIVEVGTTEKVRCTITSMRLEKSDEYTLSAETYNGRYVWSREVTTRYGLDGRYAIWPEERLTLVGRRDDVPSQPYCVNDKVYIQDEGSTVHTIGVIRYNPTGYKYELFSNGSSRLVSEQQIVSAEPYTLF